MSEQEAEAFFVRYEAQRPNYALIRDGTRGVAAVAGRELSALSEVLASSRGLPSAGDSILDLISEHLGCRYERRPDPNGCAQFAVALPPHQLRLPQPLLFFFCGATSSSSRELVLKYIDKELSHGPAASRLAVLIDPVQPEAARAVAHAFVAQQRAQVAVFDRDDLTELLLRAPDSARRHLTRLILRDVDLTFVSPFVNEGPTPDTMFFGREAEIRRIAEQIGNQSFALVGGRKAGKTSTLHRLEMVLGQRLPVFKLDCQAHPDRQDFLESLGELIPRSPSGNRPRVARAEQVLRTFLNSRFGGRFGVLLLDEVDDLFEIDAAASEYPHVLSRALRAISQSSTASIVATGERQLFELTRDPNSPHWNFCTPVPIGPLAHEAGERLIREPLAELGIGIEEEAIALALDRSGCHPNLLQYLGTGLVEQLAQQARAAGVLYVNRDLVASATGAVDFRKRFVTTFLSRATPLERLLSIHLRADPPVTIEDMRSALHDRGLRASAADVLRGGTIPTALLRRPRAP